MNPCNSTLNLTTRTPIEKDEFQKLHNIWQSLHDHADSTEFRNPVDWEGNQFNHNDSVRSSRLSDYRKKANGFGHCKSQIQ